MKSIYIIAAACIAAVSACNNAAADFVVSSDMQKYGLVYPAKSVKTSGSDDELHSLARFDRQGRLEEVVCKTPEGKLRDRSLYSYYPDGQLSEVLIYDADGNLEGREEYSWEDGCLKSKKFYGMNNEEISRIENEIEDGKIARRTSYYEGELDSFTVSHYDGNTRDDFNFGPDSTDFSTAHFEYVSGEIVSRMYSKELDIDMEIRYDGKLLPYWSRDVLLDSDGRYNYNESFLDNPERWYSYTFDRHGNWTERRESLTENGTPVAILRRKIRY